MRIEQPWARRLEEVEKRLQTSFSEGLSQQEADTRLREFGPNQKSEPEKHSVFRILLHQFKSLIILLLFVAAVISFVLGDLAEAVAILIVIFLNAQIGFWTEWKGRRSMEALLRLGEVTTRVMRGGQIMQMDARNLVPGDILVLEAGDIVPADARLFECSRLQLNESSLTGESLPVDKQTESCSVETSLSERINMLFQGTFVVRGSAKAVVTMTGMSTELGKISELVRMAKDERSPLDVRLEKLGVRLIFITLILAGVIFGIGYLRGQDVLLMLETSIALAVAAIPEGLPVVATISLANGMRLMVRQNAVMTRLSSVETLGSTTMICTDKTGTLTENEMRVRGVVLRPEEEGVWVSESEVERGGGEAVDRGDGVEEQMRQIQKVAVLCNNASIHESSKTGDPLEIALLDTFISYNNDNIDWLSRYNRLREEPFDSNTKMMAVWVQSEAHGIEVCVKGAPGVVLDYCEELSDAERSEWDHRIAEEASKGFRILGLAIRSSQENLDNINGENPYQALHFLGLVLLSDPPRNDVRDAILSCKSAGIRVVMLTGDQPETATYVAKEVGLTPSSEGGFAMHGKELPELEEMEAIPSKMEELMETSVFARITPRQKLDLIQFYQNRGEVVAMTGDGVNDAPALKKADIGISMGKRGTQVAMDASDMILRDDAFQTIVHAVRQGRIIFQNIRRFILFLLSCNVSEIVLVASTTSFGFLLTPLQILFLNLVTDVFPALALGMNRGEKGIMEQSPRDPKEPLITAYHWGEILGYGVVIAALAGLSAILSVEFAGASQEQIVTILFFTLAFSQLAHVVNIRSRKSGFLRNEVTRNFWVWVAVSICLVILAGIYLYPQVQSVLEIERLGWATWGIITACSLMITVVGHLWLRLSKKGWD